jgi:hypothetical protein
LKKKINVSLIIFIILFIGLIYTYNKYTSIKNNFENYKKNIELNTTVNEKTMDVQLNNIIKSINNKQYEKYIQRKTTFANLKLYGIRTITNYDTENDYNKFKGISNGAIAEYSVSSKVNCFVYIIKDQTKINGNMILSNTIASGLRYYSIYKIGNFFVKIDIYSTEPTIKTEDYEKIYRFTSQFKDVMEKAIKNK